MLYHRIQDLQKNAVSACITASASVPDDIEGRGEGRHPKHCDGPGNTKAL